MKNKVFFICVIALLYGVVAHCETHDFTGLQLTSDGWTDLQALVQPDSRIVYVSASGDDSTGAYYSPGDSSVGSDPFNPVGTILPYATFTAAYSQLRDGYPDILLFKRGDTFNVASTIVLDKSGRSYKERSVVGAYGVSGDRPELITPADNTALSVRCDNANVLDLYLRPTSRDPNVNGPQGVNITSTCRHLLIEGCYIYNYDDGVVAQSSSVLGSPTIDNIALRRNVIYNNWGSNGGHGQGMYAYQISHLLIEDNVWDHDGWDDTYKEPTVFDRSMYLDRVSDTVIRGNIDANGASGGVQMRQGGDYEYNLSLKNPSAVSIGHSQSIIDHTGSIRYNVILDARDIADSPRGFGISVGNRSNDVLVYDNIIAHQKSGTENIYAITITNETDMDNQDDPDPGYQYTRRTRIENNIVYKWDKNGSSLNLPTLKIGQSAIGVTVKDNIFQQPTGMEMVWYNTGTQSNGPNASWHFSNNTYYSGSNSEAFRALFSDGSTTDFTFSAWEAHIPEVGSSESEVSFPDPERDIESYAQSIGLNPTSYEDGLDKFLQGARNMSRWTWDQKYRAITVINYIREGFGRSALSYTYHKNRSHAGGAAAALR